MPLPFRLRPGERGVAVRLHELEAEVMDVVWSRDFAEFAVSDVQRVLEQRREIAYTTVMTTLSRLYDKGVLARTRNGKRYLYRPRFTREEFLKQTTREVLERIGEPARQESFALLAESVSSADAGALDELERLIQLRRKELGS
jgi:predicted transcriptional regulator